MRFCVYCGDWYQCRDHIIPVSYNKIKRDYVINEVVPACHECNSYLGNKAYHTVVSRATYLLQRYPVKYKKLLKIPDWTPQDIQAMGYNLREGLQEKMSLKLIYTKKIENLERVSRGFFARPFNIEGDEVFNVWDNFHISLDEPIDTDVVLSGRECKWCEKWYRPTNMKYAGCCSEDCRVALKEWRDSRTPRRNRYMDCTVQLKT